MSTSSDSPAYIVPVRDGKLGLDVVAPWAFRLRFTRKDTFAEGALNRYGILRRPAPPEGVKSEPWGASGLCLHTGDALLRVDGESGCAILADAAGAPLLEQREPATALPDGGFTLAFGLGPEEKLYGLGDENREGLQKRGRKSRMMLRNVSAYAPIPFLMSSGGWAVFCNTTWFHTVDAGASSPNRLVYSARGGAPDFYLIAGADLPTLLDRYTQIAGRPHLLPMWAYGLTFVCDERGVRARDVLYEAYEFRRHGIPCDTIGLEPDWMKKRYDFSVDKTWSEERFHTPLWLEGKDHSTFCAALRNMGFKLSLWLCCDYDLSEYEEKQLGNDWDPTRDWEDPRPDPGADKIQDPHLIPVYSDTITKRGIPWFEHLKKFVDDGASAFKMDGANQVLFHPDRKWRNGMSDAEMHNLYPVLLGKQMNRGFRKHTGGRRAMVYTAGGYAGIQQFAATWAGDTGGGEGPLVSLLNHGLSGHSNVSCDMEVWHPAGIHFGFLQPWSQVLSWHQYNQPWFLAENLREMFAFYARLRYRLLPYLYAAAHTAARTGLPIMRAMPLVAPEDPRSDELHTQYMLGDALLTAAFTRSLHLPAGTWIDYWNGKSLEGPADIQADWPGNRGGPLFVRAGAIIPMWEDRDFVDQKSAEKMILDIYPHDEKSAFTLYEDDGLTHAWEQGQTAITEITAATTGKQTEIAITPRRGTYDGMPADRRFELRVHLEARPQTVRVGPDILDAWQWDAESRVLTLETREDPARAENAHILIDNAW